MRGSRNKDESPSPYRKIEGHPRSKKNLRFPDSYVCSQMFLFIPTVHAHLLPMCVPSIPTRFPQKPKRKSSQAFIHVCEYWNWHQLPTSNQAVDIWIKNCGFSDFKHRGLTHDLSSKKFETQSEIAFSRTLVLYGSFMNTAGSTTFFSENWDQKFFSIIKFPKPRNRRFLTKSNTRPQHQILIFLFTTVCGRRNGCLSFTFHDVGSSDPELALLTRGHPCV